jgi:perosamine synthetase
MSELKKFIVESNADVKEALILINKNSYGICFVVSDMKLVGVLTDGDIRRALIKNIKLNDCVDKVMNRNYVAMHIDTPSKEVRKKISNHIRVIPLLNSDGRIVDMSNIKKTHAIPLMEPNLSGKESEYVNDCLDTGWISSKGKYVGKFEQKFEELHPGMHAVAVSNGTVALQLAMLAIGIKKGDEVIVPNTTFAASVNAIIHCGATPVLCEIDPVTWCIDPKEIKKLINPYTKAIMPVHLYGQVSQMDEIIKLSNENSLYVVEDCAEALGSRWKNKNVGTFGDASTFSFFGNKTITTGEGGMALFKSKDISNRAKILRDHGMSTTKRYWHEIIGFNFRLTNIQAAIGVAQLEKLDEIVQKKIHIGEYYSQLLRNHKLIAQVPKKNNTIVNSYWIFSLLLKNKINRDQVIKKLLELGIETRPVFYPLHKMLPYKNFKRSSSLENSINIGQQGLSLPSATSLTDVNIKYIVYCLDKIASD